MEVKRFSCPEEFLRHAEHALLEHEAVNNLPLGLLYLLRERQDSEAVLLSAENEQGIQLMAVMASGELILAGDERRVEAAGELAAYIKKAGIRPPGVIGQPAIAKAFADAWKRKTRVKMKQTIYQLDNVNDVSLSSGSLRKADQRDLELITDWIHSFSEEAFHDGLGHEKAKKMAARGIDKASIYVWEDCGEAVSMAQKSRPTKNGITVNLVFTPKNRRNKGYATSCVAALSRTLLDEGVSFCSLYTDQANPTSNKIYAEIGYRPVADSIVYAFDQSKKS
ncbi:GNAT family N-acetyltransferase [Bacillus sonorensis]|uniref:GNAT family N-acetyltransferase n=1 Tax=Bacillus sonorensis TaxID=119858 RepID=UPI002281BDF4|nr:GNAT family N-acetyltransferase [Bacillus sonorensis]MCZ0070726.1 GNAT family N-acetyltransferase [Bacillus sonorensis]MCZ0098197.1 GNAT family N-acetyltransferase [Bacillus sonorensis]MEC1356445.1 GNAT family N-acetyltransferase [Bacillus sonorensis]MEC1427871.1 GNAT family N-acetyltransferase [Bacillus sonorensis]MEC1519723.1 GNAT family N-acetyltransferase [Bacillus sonorensis]